MAKGGKAGKSGRRARARGRPGPPALTAAAHHQAATAHHRAGRLEAAEAGYRAALEAAPELAEALNDYGVLLKATGRTAEAVAHLRRAAELRPDYADAHYNLGNALRQAGRPEAAETSYRRAIEVRPDHLSYTNLGLTLKDLGRLEEARTALARAAELAAAGAKGAGAGPGGRAPADVVGMLDAARADLEAGRPAQAEKAVRAILDAHEAGAAIPAARLAAAHTMLSVALRSQGRPGEAIEHYEKAIALEPVNPNILNNLGNALKDDGQLEAALACFARGLELAPDDAGLHHNYAVALSAAARFVEALEHLDASLARRPDNVDTRWERALVLLRLGDYRRGWPAYEARWDLPSMKGGKMSAPEWAGEAFRGKTLLLYTEQGFGDVIQCARYLPAVKKQGGTVIVDCKPELARLLASVEGIDRIVPRGERPPAFDLAFPILNLPGLFTPDPASVPARVPYLAAPDELREKHAPLFAGHGDKLKVGIFWSGSITFKGNRQRALRLARFLEHFALPGVQLFSLQKGPPEIQLRTVPAAAPIVDLAPHLGDFADTAAVLGHLDLVLMTDSAVAHLAGALGRPVWVMLSAVPHWLWLTGREDTPWYPTMRLFRQAVPGEWSPVLAAVRAELEKVAAGDRARLYPPLYRATHVIN